MSLVRSLDMNNDWLEIGMSVSNGRYSDEVKLILLLDLLSYTAGCLVCGISLSCGHLCFLLLLSNDCDLLLALVLDTEVG